MNLIKLVTLILLSIQLVSFGPVLADDLDEECKSFCINNGSEDGHYLAPEPNVKCEDGYEQSSENEICCCKPKAQEQ